MSRRNFWEVCNILCQQHFAFIFIHHRTKFLVGNEELSIGILHHEVQAFLWITWVERLVSTTCLQHAERGNRHPLAARNENGNHIALLHAFADEMLGNLVGKSIHFFVSESLVFVNHSCVIAILFHLLTEERDNGLRRIECHVVVVEAVELSQLLRIDERNVGEWCIGMFHQVLGYIDNGNCQLLHHVLAVFAIVVLQLHRRLSVYLLNENGNREFRHLSFETLQKELLSTDGVFVHDAHLISEHDFGREVEVGCYLGKRIILMASGIIKRSAGVFDKVEHLFIRNLGTHGKRVDKHSHRVVDGNIRTSVADGDKCDIRRVGKTGECVEHRRQEQMSSSDSVLLTERFHLIPIDWSSHRGSLTLIIVA